MHTQSFRQVVAAGAVILSCAAPSFAAERGADLPKNDKQFMTQAAQDGLVEVKLGKLAAEKATDPKVKSFAQQMVTDHSAANDKLMAIAKQKDFALPAEPSPEQQRVCSSLEGLSGAAFDRAYVDQMVKDHQKAVALFEKESSSSDPELMAFAKETLPTLRHHLKEAQALPVVAAAPSHTKNNDAGNRTHVGKPRGASEAEKTEHDLKQEH